MAPITLPFGITVLSTTDARGYPAIYFSLPGDAGKLLVTKPFGGDRFAAVLSAYVKTQGQGDGFKLYATALEHIRSLGYDGLMSSHESRSPAADEFWSSLQQHGAEIEDIGSALVMRGLGPTVTRDFVQMAFAARIPDAELMARALAGEAITAISEETRLAIRVALERGLAEGIPPYELAKQLQGMIGLTRQQAMSVLDYRTTLVDSGLALDRIDVLVGRYASKLELARAQTVARTETMRALNTGQLWSARNAQAAGLLHPAAKKVWMAARDSCPTCGKLDSVSTSLDGTFTYRGTQLDGPPAHPNCRCSVAIEP